MKVTVEGSPRVTIELTWGEAKLLEDKLGNTSVVERSDLVGPEAGALLEQIWVKLNDVLYEQVK